jgi:hypothetical protein
MLLVPDYYLVTSSEESRILLKNYRLQHRAEMARTTLPTIS